MNRKPGTDRRYFIRTTFNSIIVSSAVPSLLSTMLMSCRPLQALAKVEPSGDLKKLQALMADKKNPLKWVFSGDSITEGAKHTYGYRSYPEIFSEHIRFEMGRARDFIINTAISGHATPDVLGDFEWRISQFNPQVVSIMIGTNDAAVSRKISVNMFENNLHLLIQKFRDINAIPVLHTPNTIRIGERTGENEREQLPLYIAAIRKVAANMQAILIDNWSFWESNHIKVLEEKWLADPLHPGGWGHLEIARLLFRTLGICDDQSFTCTGTIHF